MIVSGRGRRLGILTKPSRLSIVLSLHIRPFKYIKEIQSMPMIARLQFTVPFKHIASPYYILPSCQQLVKFKDQRPPLKF